MAAILTGGIDLHPAILDRDGIMGRRGTPETEQPAHIWLNTYDNRPRPSCTIRRRGAVGRVSAGAEGAPPEATRARLAAVRLERLAETLTRADEPETEQPASRKTKPATERPAYIWINAHDNGFSCGQLASAGQESMFTGIVEEVGTILSADLESPFEGLTVEAHEVLSGTRPGDSIAVNGACLTVTKLGADRFSVGVMPETVRRTNLGDLTVGDTVNLERPVRPDSRLGGHFVQGHVDGTGTVTSVVPDGNALAIRIETAPDLLRYIVEKGFIAVDGASLTVTNVDAQGFGVALIPYTQQHVAAGLHRERHRVNLEVDILAKYVEKLVVH